MKSFRDPAPSITPVTYLMRWARRKFKRLRAFKRFKSWWHGLLRREPDLFVHWVWMPEF